MRKHTKQRPRAYETLTPWSFQDLPPDHKARQTAVFVVHGIGNQAYSDTAAELRSGFEDALSDIFHNSRKAGKGAKGGTVTRGTLSDAQEPLPPPFIYEGYWANYDNIEETFPEKWATFTEGERGFFAMLWKRRSQGTIRTAWWFIQQNFRLWRWKTVIDFGWATGVGLMGMAPLTVTAAGAMSVTSPRVLAGVLSDVRVYCDPRGSIEEAIVQRIDRRVGERFLKLLGLDWDLNDLLPDQLLVISGKPHVFDYVTWVSHSLGTIISYNVISDILHRVEDQEQVLKTRPPNVPDTEEDSRRRRNLERVKKGLHRFYTLGSPLHPISLLFSNVLRPWPQRTTELMFGERQTKNWWANFHYASDPISDRLGLKFPLAVNRHTKNLWRIPGKAHNDYFADKDILKYIISRGYGRDLCKWEDPEFLSDRKYIWWRRVLLNLMLVLAWLVFAVAVVWFVSGGGVSWVIGRATLWFKRL